MEKTLHGKTECLSFAHPQNREKKKQQPNEDSYMNSLGFIIDTKNYNKFTVTVFPLKSFFCLKI